jgi:hypothetical protein
MNVIHHLMPCWKRLLCTLFPSRDSYLQRLRETSHLRKLADILATQKKKKVKLTHIKGWKK